MKYSEFKSHLKKAYLDTYSFSGFDPVEEKLIGEKRKHAAKTSVMVRSFFGIPNRESYKGGRGAWLGVYDTVKMPFNFALNIVKTVTELTPLFYVKKFEYDKATKEFSIIEEAIENPLSMYSRPKTSGIDVNLAIAKGFYFFGRAITSPSVNFRLCVKEASEARKNKQTGTMIWAIFKAAMSVVITSAVFAVLFPIAVKIGGLVAIGKTVQAIASIPVVGKYLTIAGNFIAPYLSQLGGYLVGGLGLGLSKTATALGLLFGLATTTIGPVFASAINWIDNKITSKEKANRDLVIVDVEKPSHDVPNEKSPLLTTNTHLGRAMSERRQTFPEGISKVVSEEIKSPEVKLTPANPVQRQAVDEALRKNCGHLHNSDLNHLSPHYRVIRAAAYEDTQLAAIICDPKEGKYNLMQLRNAVALLYHNAKCPATEQMVLTPEQVLELREFKVSRKDKSTLYTTFPKTRPPLNDIFPVAPSNDRKDGGSKTKHRFSFGKGSGEVQ